MPLRVRPSETITDFAPEWPVTTRRTFMLYSPLCFGADEAAGSLYFRHDLGPPLQHVVLLSGNGMELNLVVAEVSPQTFDHFRPGAGEAELLGSRQP